MERRQLTWVVTAATLLVGFHAAYFVASVVTVWLPGRSPASGGHDNDRRGLLA